MSTQNKNKNEFIDFGELFTYYLSYWKWFLLSVVLAVVLAVIFVKLKSPVYAVYSNVLVKTEDSKSASASALSSTMKGLPFAGMAMPVTIEDEVNIIASHTLMRSMIKDLSLNEVYTLKKFPFDKPLYNNSPLKISIPEGFSDTLTSIVSLSVDVDDRNAKVKIEYGKEVVGSFDAVKLPGAVKTEIGTFLLDLDSRHKNKNSSFGIALDILGLDIAAEKYMKIINIETVSKKSNMMSLSIKDTEKQRGLDILNKLTELYVNDALNDKNKTAEKTAEFIKERIEYMSADLGQVESDIQNYKIQNNIIDISREAGIYMGAKSDLERKSIEFEIQKNISNMIEEYIQNPKNKYALIPLGKEGTEGMQSAVTTYNDAILERARLLQNTTEQNPVIHALNKQIDMLRGGVEQSLSSLKSELALAQKDWDREEQKIDSKLGNVPRQEREFVNISRQREIKSEMYIFLLGKLQEAELTLAANATKVKIVDKAYVLSRPVAPRSHVIVMIALVLGLMLPVVVLWGINLFKVKLSNVSELQRYTSLPILGEVCKNRGKDNIVVSDSGTSSIAELFRLLRTNIQFILSGKDEKVVLVTSSIAGEGKSFFVANLALSFSLLENKKTVIVGLDIRKPRLSEYLNIDKNRKGLTTYLSSSCSEDDIIVNLISLNPNLYCIPSGPIPPNPSELLMSEKLDKLFVHLRENFDCIIVDTAPVGMVADTFLLNRLSDATICLFRADYTSKSHLRFLENVAKDGKLKKVSLVMNGTATKSGYGYGYSEKK